jgi:hypothetical protein
MFCSSHDAAADRVTGLRAGGDDFVGKDISDDELLARVEALVRVKKLLDEALRTQESPGDTRATTTAGEPIATLEHHLDREFNRALKHNQPLSLVIVAIPADNEVANKLQACGRGNEIVASHPDHGYAVLLPNTLGWRLGWLVCSYRCDSVEAEMSPTRCVVGSAHCTWLVEMIRYWASILGRRSFDSSICFEANKWSVPG